MADSSLPGSAPGAARRWQELLPDQATETDLLSRAQTHRSAGRAHYERLEFLGDAVLGLVIAERLYLHNPDAPEGDLTRLRAHLVNRVALAEIGREWGFGSGLSLGSGEKKSGGARRESILADVVEATIGAIFLTSGLDQARDFVTALFGPRLEQLPTAEDLKDPKTRLQELLQKHSKPLPVYRLVERAGPDHAATFEVRATVDLLKLTACGRAQSRRAAEQEAAGHMLADPGLAAALKRRA